MTAWAGGSVRYTSRGAEGNDKGYSILFRKSVANQWCRLTCCHAVADITGVATAFAGVAKKASGIAAENAAACKPVTAGGRAAAAQTAARRAASPAQEGAAAATGAKDSSSPDN